MLVVGAGGQVGGALMARLAARAVGTWRRPPPGSLELDLEQVALHPELADAVVQRSAASLVMVSAGMTNVDACEDAPLQAARVNSVGPARLAGAARRAGARTIFFSTDYVFDGNHGPYGEEDETRPLSVYGRTKSDGEAAVLDADPAALVLRTTVVYGPEAHGRNFAYQVAARLQRGEAVTAAVDQISTPTYNIDLSEATVALVDAAAVGVVHVAGPELLDRVAFARRLAEAMGFDPGRVEGRPTAALGQRAGRPLSAGLAITRLRRLLPGFEPRTVEDALAHWPAVAPVPWR